MSYLLLHCHVGRNLVGRLIDWRGQMLDSQGVHERLLPLRNWTKKMVIFSNTMVCGGKKMGIGIFKNVCPFHKTQAKNLASTETNKNKKQTSLLYTNFKIQLWFFFAQNDFFTLKVLKTQFIFGWAIIWNIAHSICNLGSAKDKLRF